MIIGVPKEIKNHEYRVGLTAESVVDLVYHGHQVLVEQGAGVGVGCDDNAYVQAGAKMARDAAQVFAEAEMIVKVKEPLAQERSMLRDKQILFTYLHLAADAEQTRDLVASGAVCIAYETVTDDTGGLPLLKPMSQVAGRLSIQSGALALEKSHGGLGVLLGGVPGVEPAKVVIIGGGVVGFNAAQMAVGLHSDVTIIDRNSQVLERLANHFEGRVKVLHANRSTVENCLCDADLLIGAVLVPGAAAPKIVTREMLGTMRAGSVIVDVAIDQGGCFETSRATTHDLPTYIVDGVVHYCVANMPGAVARTSTYALNNVTLKYVTALADKGWQATLGEDVNMLQGLNVCRGKVTCQPVAEAFGYEYVTPEQMLC